MPTKPKELPYHTFDAWMEAGYLYRELRCGARYCGLPVVAFYLPNDQEREEIWVDPVTHLAHLAVCGDPRRVAAMHMRKDRESGRRLDWKQRQAGDR